MEESFYTVEGSEFVSTVNTRGPWNPQHQHAGPPSALLARQMERLPAAQPMRVARFYVEIPRPVPIAKLRIESSVIRETKKTRVTQAVMHHEGKEICKASALWIRAAEQNLPNEARERTGSPPPLPDGSKPFVLPFFTGDKGYHTSMEVRIASGGMGTGACQAWMRMRVPLLPGEKPSGLQRVMIAADSGNGVSMGLPFGNWIFINPDLSVSLLRYPQGEWVCLDAKSFYDSAGIGLATTVLHDEKGPIGHGLQSLLVEERS